MGSWNEVAMEETSTVRLRLICHNRPIFRPVLDLFLTESPLRLTGFSGWRVVGAVGVTVNTN